MPAFDAAGAPRLDASGWPAERLARTHRSYAMEYVRTMLPVLQELLGAQVALEELGRVARLIGLQFHEETAESLGLPSNLSAGTPASASSFARWLAAILAAQGEVVDAVETPQGAQVSLQGWHLAGDARFAAPLAAFDAWNELWIGGCAAHDRFLRLSAERSHGADGWSVRWTIAGQERA